MIKFEVVSKYKDIDIDLIPKRKTSGSAGYDFTVAETCIIPPATNITHNLSNCLSSKDIVDFSDVLKLTKEKKGLRMTLVSTGVKCQLEKDTYLELSLRSSTPLKSWLIMGNSIGIIDSDYFNNPDNEGEIFFELINLTSKPIRLNKGDVIGQGIIKKYLTVDDEIENNQERKGGFGSTKN